MWHQTRSSCNLHKKSYISPSNCYSGMNTITIAIDIDDPKLRHTLHTTIEVEMEATRTDRGEARTEIDGKTLRIIIHAEDYVAARAITNSIMRLLQASVDVAESISISKE